MFSILLCALIAGCASSTLPPPLSQVESERWTSTHLNYTVGVEPYHWHAYSDSLISALAGTKLFISVKPLDQCTTPPSLIARVEEPYNGGVATIPIWTFLTLGFVPRVEHEGFGYDFSLQFSNGQQHPYPVQFVCQSTTTMGWVALLEALSPDVGLWSVERSDRFRGRFALAILDSLAAKPAKVDSSRLSFP